MSGVTRDHPPPARLEFTQESTSLLRPPVVAPLEREELVDRGERLRVARDDSHLAAAGERMERVVDQRALWARRDRMVATRCSEMRPPSGSASKW